MIAVKFVIKFCLHCLVKELFRVKKIQYISPKNFVNDVRETQKYLYFHLQLRIVKHKYFPTSHYLMRQ